jgi:hypothetical protein
MLNIKDVQNRIDRLVGIAEQTLSKAQKRYVSLNPEVPHDDWRTLRSLGLAFIESTFGKDHSYYTEFDVAIRDNYQSEIEQGFGVLKAVQFQIQSGWVETTKGLVTAEVFGDFLEMARHLLDEKYKDAAAVMIGGVLEEHLRQLCKSNAIDIEDDVKGKLVPRKADRLNSELAKKKIYDNGEQKQVTAWLDLRNNAAHGNYSKYDEARVALMLDGVQGFVNRIRP